MKGLVFVAITALAISATISFGILINGMIMKAEASASNSGPAIREVSRQGPLILYYINNCHIVRDLEFKTTSISCDL